MTTNLATVEITRARSALNMLRAYSVLIDGDKVDALDAGATRRYALPAGAHEIGVAMDFYKSLPCALTLREGETVRLECGEKAPLVGQGGFSLRGLGDASRTLNVVGRLTEVPNTSACCRGNDGNRFRTDSEMNGVICRICERSSGFWMR